MVHHDVERKCSLLTRFLVENLRGYPEKVRDNLSVYLNTAEKIRLKISRNSLTLTDRTIWHNKLERIPISLIKECKVDYVSPKICYFANETVTNKYQIIVVLCKTADDSFRLVNLLQHKINTQGHYRAHCQWLKDGSFSVADERLTPKTKHKTIASVEIVSSPKQTRKFSWGSQSKKPKGNPLPKSTFNESLGFSANASNESSPLNDDEYHDYAYIKDTAQISQPINKDNHQTHRFSVISTRSITSNLDPPDDLSNAPILLSQDASPKFRHSSAWHEDWMTPHDISSEKLIPEADQRQLSIHCAASKPYTARLNLNITDQEEQTVVMRKTRKSKAVGNRRGLSVRDTMRSSVVQYDSDADGTETTKQLQHNSNGIARVVVGGNEANSASGSFPTSLHTDSSSVTVAAEGSTHESISNDNEAITSRGDDDEQSRTRRQSGDGATSTNTPPLQRVNFVVGDEDKMDNALDGIYDNINSLKAADQSQQSQNIPVTIEELLESCKLKEDVIDSAAPASAPAAPASASDDEEEEYQLVLTGLKQLTKRQSKSDINHENRYPHQIMAAMSASQMSNANSEAWSGDIEPIAVTPKRVQPMTKASSAPAKPSPVGAPKAPTSSPVQKRTKSKQQNEVGKPARPQSVGSALHLVRNSSDQRRSSRRQGQYKSIAEYEKLNSGIPATHSAKSKTPEVKNKLQKSSTKRDSVYKTTKNELPLSPRSRHKQARSTSPQKALVSSANLSTSPTANLADSRHHAFPDVHFRKDEKNSSSKGKVKRDSEIVPRRDSVISITSVPNHVILRRVSNNDVRVMNPERRAAAERKSRSFDRKNMGLSMHKMAESNVVQNGLTLVGSRSSLISHGKSQSNVMTDSRILHHSESNSHLSLGEPSVIKTSVHDGRNLRARSQTRPAVAKSSLQWTPLPEQKHKLRVRYITLPNTPEMSHYRHPQTINGQHIGLNGTPWEQNPGFKRFFDSILTYGPNGSKSDFKDVVKPVVMPNQPDIVLESLTPDHMSQADNSDSESSIRSSASAYWPAELKQQPLCNDFEEAASWKFHSPAGS